jgi:LasA protease
MNDSRQGKLISVESRRRSPITLAGRGARLLALLGIGALGVLTVAASGMAAEPTGQDELDRAVVQEMLGQEGTPEVEPSAADEKTQTNVERASDDGRWAFGTAVILAPEKKGAYPEGRLFVAEKTGEEWKVSLDGSSMFAEMAGEAPTAVMSEGEKETFAPTSDYTVQAVNTKLQLPWKRGTSWRMAGGPHGWSTGYDRPYSALDFAGGKGRVRAAGGGKVYTMCGNNKGWIRVYHTNGYATDYYHLRKNIKPRDGKKIKAGAFLGYTGTDVSCGGGAHGRHVHFALLRGDQHIAVDDKTIGGWTFHQGKAYKGYATHKGVKRYPGDRLRNFGR